MSQHSHESSLTTLDLDLHPKLLDLFSLVKKTLKAQAGFASLLLATRRLCSRLIVVVARRCLMKEGAASLEEAEDAEGGGAGGQSDGE